MPARIVIMQGYTASGMTVIAFQKATAQLMIIAGNAMMMQHAQKLNAMENPLLVSTAGTGMILNQEKANVLSAPFIQHATCITQKTVKKL